MDDFSMRYAHCDGYTDICFDGSGSYLVTGGTDGDIRIYNGFDDDDPQSQSMGKSVTSLALKNKMLYVANDAFRVSAYTFPEVEFEGIIAEYNSEVYHIACNEEGNLVASGGGDFIIKVYDTSNKSLVAFRGHDGPVLGIAFDIKGKYLASTSCDGTVRIWQLSDQECTKILKIFKKNNDKSLTSSQCRVCWSPDGQFLAVPVENEVRIYTRDLWEVTFTLKDDSIVQNTSVVNFSPFGNYIAAACLDGQIVVWDMKKKACVSRKAHEKKLAVCSFAWNTSGKDIVFCDIEGQMGIYENPLTFSQSQETNVVRKDIPIDFECEDDGDKNLEDMDTNDLDLLHEENDDDENAFDIAAIKAELEPKIFGTDDDDIENASIKGLEKPEGKIQVIEAPKPLIQTAFQPSSTPVHLERRFMLWNNVGIIRCYNTEEENTIDVEFHDANVYHALHLNNTRNHTLAALSTEALLMACHKVDESSSKLECVHFGTWDSNKEWIMEMTENEDIESVALGEGFAVCVTNKRMLRIFTVSGVQCEVISIPGPVVCIAAKEKQVTIAYHRGLGIENDQCMNLLMVDVRLGGHCVIKDYPLPLSSKSFLSWLGYTDEGHPCVVDSSGVVNILNIRFGLKWIPVANTKNNLKGKSDTYFVLGLSEIKQEIRCILCKGARYPGLLPRPTVIVLPFSLPFCEMSADKGLLEEENRRYSMMHKRLEGLLKEGFDLESEFSTAEKKWMGILLKMFALATRTDREYRALDIAELMPNTMVIQGAIKYATQRHRLALAERLGEVMNKKLLEVEEEAEVDDPISDYDSFNMSQNTSYSKYLKPKKKDEDEIILKPKPLYRPKHDAARTSKNSESLLLDVNSNSEDLENVSTPKSSPASNPFKAKQKSAKDSSSPSIDTLLDSSTKHLHNKSSSPTVTPKAVPKASSSKKTKPQEPKIEAQLKLNQVQPEPPSKKYGFLLFLEQNRDSIICSSDSELSETEIIKTAMKMYKALPESDKQKYVEQKDTETEQVVLSDKTNESVTAEDEGSSESLLATASANTLKRKENLETEGDILKPPPKKSKSNSSKLSDTTVRKLTQFAFTKTSK